MSQLKVTSKNYIIDILNQDKLNVSLLYDRSFFSLFHFQDFHVNSYGENEPIGVTTKKGVIKQGSMDLDESDLSIATEILGNEKVPDGYSQLPLQLTPQKGGQSFLKDMENSLTSVQSKYSKYFSLPTDSKKEPLKEELTDSTMNNKDIKVTFPKEFYSVEHLPSLLKTGTSSSFSHFSTNLDYYELEQIIKDLIFQLDYFQNEGIVFSEINADSIYKINDRYLLIDSTNMVLFKEEKQKKFMYDSLYQLLVNLMGKTLDDSMYIVPYSKLYYCMHRLDKEKVFLWI